MTGSVVLIRHGDGPADDRGVQFFRERGIEPENATVQVISRPMAHVLQLDG